MRKLFHAAWIWCAIGLASGLFYREYTKAHGFRGRTQLAVVHTHALALGMIGMLLVLVIAASFPLERVAAGWLTAFFWTYNAGLFVTVAMMTLHGMLQVDGHDQVSAAISGVAGLGHMLLTVGLICLFVALGKALPSDKSAEPTV